MVNSAFATLLFTSAEHDAIVPRDLWDRAHAILQVSPRSRAAQNRQHAPALLKGLIFGIGGRAMSPTHAVKNGRRYCYYVAQRVLILNGHLASDVTLPALVEPFPNLWEGQREHLGRT
ncbi:hypothetical protein [Neoroseomonas terrae]|uniref:hypothetical protein n=1 Tax=Neoroseomonas terrae TaxID=424799 RepID=UPI001BA51D1A|nr:hypothetical protein [Neoroseomonas terrae]